MILKIKIENYKKCKKTSQNGGHLSCVSLCKKLRYALGGEDNAGISTDMC